ncbi:MAG: hypothetical protein ABIP94_15015 [Planctomycetota bacterium]
MLLVLATTVVAVCGLWPATGFLATWWQWVGWPYPRMILLVGVFVVVATVGGGRRRLLWALAASGSLLALWCSFRVLSMGDAHWWREAAIAGTLTWTEALSSCAYLGVARLFGHAAIEWISPALGFVTTYAWLRVTDRLFATSEGREAVFARLVSALMWVGSGVCVLFFHCFVELTQVGMPLFLLGVANLTVWSRDVMQADGVVNVRSGPLFVGVVQLAFATMSHAQYAGMLSAALGAVLLVGLRLGVVRVAKGAALVLAIIASAVGLTIAIMQLSSSNRVVGNVTGGADARLLVDFVDARGSWLGTGTLLSADHLALVAHIFVFACPLVVPFALAVPWSVRKRSGWPHDLVLVSTGLAYVGFAACFSFDFGWPRDVDLMVSMSPSLLLLVTAWLSAATCGWSKRGKVVLSALLLAMAMSTWSVIAPLVRPTSADLSQRNSPIASLFVNGIGEGAGPFRLQVAAGEVVHMQASGPPGASFWICKGLPHPVCEGHPYGGVADIEFVGGLQPAAFVHAGKFDAEGKAAFTWTVQPLADGRSPGLQMIVFSRSKGGEEPTSAAFYFELQ